MPGGTRAANFGPLAMKAVRQKFVNAGWSRKTINQRVGRVRRVFKWAEDRMVHGSGVVVTICQELQNTVTDMGVGDRALLIENVMGGDVEDPPSLTAAEVSRQLRRVQLGRVHPPQGDQHRAQAHHHRIAQPILVDQRRREARYRRQGDVHAHDPFLIGAFQEA